MANQSPKRKTPAKAGKTRSDSATTGARSKNRQRQSAKTSGFDPRNLDQSVIAIPLLNDLKNKPSEIHAVVIDLNLRYPTGLEDARQWVIKETGKLIKDQEPGQGINKEKGATRGQYVFAKLRVQVIRELVKRDQTSKSGQAIYRIWPDFKVSALINKSISTVKADAARASFSALGEGIVWAVLDSGIDEHHPHFKRHENLVPKAPLEHADFTGERYASPGSAKKDALGHGTHVAGIIAGELIESDQPQTKIRAFTHYRKEGGEVDITALELRSISGIAPKCKLLSFKVLDENGEGTMSSVLAAIAKIQEINGYGHRIVIHGVNMSIGYDFDPEWFACGQSPLCVEVDHLVRSGVVVVVAAGNAGYGYVQSEQQGTVHAGLDMTISDPGNAELAITVGSTHRESPHTYGVSYFSSRGPTGDGRIKPDLVAPGEKIISCAVGKLSKEFEKKGCNYLENSGTSMSAPHVSGVIAAFLSVRREFIGEPEKVKRIFLSTATDLRRDRYFQGAGMVDLMRAIQSV